MAKKPVDNMLTRMKQLIMFKLRKPNLRKIQQDKTNRLKGTMQKPS